MSAPARPKKSPTSSPKAGGSVWRRIVGALRPASAPALVLAAILLMLATNGLMRLLFLAYNWGGGWEFAAGDTPGALAMGLRFDLATIAIFAGLLLVLMTVPPLGTRKGLRRLVSLMALLQLPVLFVNAIDVVYFGFASKRLSHEFFSGGNAAYNFGMDEILPYWWLILVVAVVGLGQWWLLLRWAGNVQPSTTKSTWRKALSWISPVLMAGLVFLAFRGGLQTRPLRPANAFTSPSVFLGNVSLNSAYTVMQSMEIGNEAEVEFMPMAEAVALSRALVKNDFDGPFQREDYPLLRTTQFAEPERKYNVVLLIVESLNANKLGFINGAAAGHSLTPTLDSLARTGLAFTNFYANGARSVQSLPAILNSTPDIFERPLIGSSFETNQQWGIGNMLAQRGYHTSFVCGGPNGTLGFDSFSKVSGFAHYYGQSDYPGPDAAVASNWGLHDHPTLTWLADLQASFPKPFLNVWFSISNHHPFALPADCPPSIAQSALSPMDKTVAYTDWALGQYFAKVRQQEWYNNTVFVITGDHCFFFEDDPDRSDVQNTHVPLILLGPGLAPAQSDRIGSHISILPTLIELLRLRTQYAGVGVSLLSQHNQPFHISGIMDLQTLAREDKYYITTFETALGNYRWIDGKWQADAGLATSPEGLAMDRQLRAIYQLCSHMRRHNAQNLPQGMGDLAPAP